MTMSGIGSAGSLVSIRDARPVDRGSPDGETSRNASAFERAGDLFSDHRPTLEGHGLRLPGRKDPRQGQRRSKGPTSRFCQTTQAQPGSSRPKAWSVSLTKAVVKALRGMNGMPKVTAEDVVRFWRDYASAGTAIPVQATCIAPEPSDPLPHVPSSFSIQSTRSESGPTSAIPLTSIVASQVTGKKVMGIVLSNGETIAVTRTSNSNEVVAAFLTSAPS